MKSKRKNGAAGPPRSLAGFKAGTGAAVLMDFDGTVTDIDVVDGLLVQFAAKRDWIRHERDWVEGRISSLECMKKQLALVRVTPRELSDYLASVNVDAGFVPLVEFLKSRKVPLLILSDGFDLLIRTVLRANGMGGVRFKANALELRGGRLVPSFPHKSRSCARCGHCKRATIKAHRRSVKRFVFVGDGLSDVCAAEVADVVYAKGKLAAHCARHKIAFRPYTTLRDVLESLPAVLKNHSSEEADACARR